MFGLDSKAEKCIFFSQQLVLVYFSQNYFYTDFFPISPSCGLDRIRIVNNLRN